MDMPQETRKCIAPPAGQAQAIQIPAQQFVLLDWVSEKRVDVQDEERVTVRPGPVS